MTAPFAHQPPGAQCDGLLEAVGESLHLHELRVQVVPGCLGKGRVRVGLLALPAGNARVDSPLQRIRAKVRTPWPADQVRFHRTSHGIHPDGAVATNHHRANVARVQAVATDNLAAAFRQCLGRVRRLHPVDAAGVEKAAQVFAKPEDGRPGRSSVTAHPFEQGRSELYGVAEDVNGGILPADDLPVPPDPVNCGNLA